MATSVMSVPGRRRTASAANLEGSVPDLAPPPGLEFSGGARIPRNLASSKHLAKDKSRAVKGGHVLERRAKAASAGEPAKDNDRKAGSRANNLDLKDILYIKIFKVIILNSLSMLPLIVYHIYFILVH